MSRARGQISGAGRSLSLLSLIQMCIRDSAQPGAAGPCLLYRCV
ncbi:hypothetical protein [Sphingobium sp. B2]